jgi:hypothetical protein
MEEDGLEAAIGRVEIGLWPQILKVSSVIGHSLPPLILREGAEGWMKMKPYR